MWRKICTIIFSSYERVSTSKQVWCSKKKKNNFLPIEAGVYDSVTWNQYETHHIWRSIHWMAYMKWARERWQHGEGISSLPASVIQRSEEIINTDESPHNTDLKFHLSYEAALKMIPKSTCHAQHEKWSLPPNFWGICEINMEWGIAPWRKKIRPKSSLIVFKMNHFEIHLQSCSWLNFSHTMLQCSSLQSCIFPTVNVPNFPVTPP